jgi:hypothetical protein
MLRGTESRVRTKSDKTPHCRTQYDEPLLLAHHRRTAEPSGQITLFDHGHGDSDDMLDAVLDASVAAARLYPADH